MNRLDDPTILRTYLLGTLNDEVVQGRIEERLMIDEEFVGQVGIIEDELIEEFLDGELNAEESDRFNRFFLTPPERKRQLRLIQSLRRVSASEANQNPHHARSSADRISSFGWLRYGLAAAIVLLAGIGVWQLQRRVTPSDTDRGIAALQDAYKQGRPFESRITSLNGYAPYSETRGPIDVSSSADLDAANSYLRDATRNANDGGAHAAYANYYLAAGDFVRAEREMDIALRAQPNDARIQSDAGALYLEKAKSTRDDNARKMSSLDESIRHLDRAITLDSKLPEPRFNRALCLELLLDIEQAKSAWRDYLQLDSGSKWADEARQHLESLERQTPTERSAINLESDFLAAFRAGDEAAASKLIAENRELVRDKYLPLRLAMSYVLASEDRRDELLRALEYSGDLEMKSTGDPFAKEIALFYRTTLRSRLDSLAPSAEGFRSGVDDCLNSHYADALPKLQAAQKNFQEAGDQATANVARYFVAYATKNLRMPLESARQEFASIEQWARFHDYRWLRMTALHWVGQCLIDLKELSAARRTFEEALDMARKLGDSYGRQRNLITLAQVHSICGQNDNAVGYAYAALEESTRPETSLRQRYRNLFASLPILSQAKLVGAVSPASMEAVQLADNLNAKDWMSQSRTFAATAAAETGKTETARVLFDESGARAAVIPAPETRDPVTALANLKSADFEMSLKNFSAAEQLYAQAAQYYDAADKFPLLREQAHQGLLLAYLHSGKSADELERQIELNIRQTEEYRTRIASDMSIGFFDLRGNVFDVASEFEFDRGNKEKAYEYAEQSSARTLLEQMRKRVTSDEHPDASDNSVLGLNELRSQLPANVTLLQYSVFDDKTIIWTISRESFDAVAVPITRTDLETRISEFANAIASTSDGSDAIGSGKELYRLLIEPALPRLNRDREVGIIPSGVLFDIPFAALINADGRPLVTDFRLVISPSANVFVESTRNALERTTKNQESVLAVGNPAFPKSRFERLPDLADAESEAAQVRTYYSDNSKLLRRNDATKSAFLNALPAADVIHFAGHYISMPGSPMSSFLLLASDGDDPAKSELSNLELQKMSLPRTKLMVFAACDSGIESYYRSEGMAGMSRTILAAKVPLIVASQWNVDSAATARLMARFHEARRKEHLSTTAALRAAQLDLINDPTGRFRSPYYWAAFAVYGGHADF